MAGEGLRWSGRPSSISIAPSAHGEEWMPARPQRKVKLGPGRPGFMEWVALHPTPNWGAMPLTHITRGVIADDILRSGQISPSPCRVFEQPLAYFSTEGRRTVSEITASPKPNHFAHSVSCSSRRLSKAPKLSMPLIRVLLRRACTPTCCPTRCRKMTSD